MTARAAGFTVVEVLVALAIFVVLAVAVLGSLPGILRVNQRSRADQDVTVAVKSYLEGVRAAFNAPAVTVDPVTGDRTTAGQTAFDAAALPDPPGPERAGGYTCAATTEARVTTPPDTGARVTVRRVTLTCERAGQPTVTFVADYARPP